MADRIRFHLNEHVDPAIRACAVRSNGSRFSAQPFASIDGRINKLAEASTFGNRSTAIKERQTT